MELVVEVGVFWYEKGNWAFFFAPPLYPTVPHCTYLTSDVEHLPQRLAELSRLADMDGNIPFNMLSTMTSEPYIYRKLPWRYEIPSMSSFSSACLPWVIGR